MSNQNGKMSLYVREETKQILGDVPRRGISLRLADVVFRYSQMVTELMPGFTEPEWRVIMESNKKNRYKDPAETIWINVAQTGREIAPLYNVDAESLIVRLRGLDRVELMAMQEACVRFWQDGGRYLADSGAKIIDSIAAPTSQATS